jgi:hypothetical protein
MTEEEKLALANVLERARDDAEDYMLGPHAKLDYCDEYPEALERVASEFRGTVSLLLKLGMPWPGGTELADTLADVAKAERADMQCTCTWEDGDDAKCIFHHPEVKP